MGVEIPIHYVSAFYNLLAIHLLVLSEDFFEVSLPIDQWYVNLVI